MRIYIQAFHGSPWNEECHIALDFFQKLGCECILFSSTDELLSIGREDIVIGGTLVTRHAFSNLGINPANFSYPSELSKYYGRKIWKIQLSQIGNCSFPVFVKPVEDKLFRGFIAKDILDINEISSLPPSTEILCSEVVDIISEWRCFVVYRKILGIKHYFGNSRIRCDEKVITDTLSDYYSCPAGCALDFGVTSKGQTILIEVNDGYALGNYGLEPEPYCKLLSARWAELTGIEDVFAMI